MRRLLETHGRSAALIASIALAAVVVVASAARLHFGVDLTDEAYYAVMPYRFVLGDKPYVSDLNVRQNSALLIMPLVKLWVSLMGGTGGLMLFLRYAYLVARVLIAVLGMRALWNRAPRAVAIIAPLMICAFVFFGIPALSYNTIPASALTGALFCFLLWVETGQLRHAAAVVVLGGIAAFAHPGVSLAAAATCAAMVWLAPTRAARRGAERVVLAAVVFAVLLLVAIAVAVGAENLGRLVSGARLYSGPVLPAQRVIELPARFVSVIPRGALIVPLWLAMWFTRTLSRPVVAGILVVFALLVLPLDPRATFACIAMASLPLTFRVWLETGERDLFVASVLSVSCGFAVSLLSGMGFWNASVGADAAAVLFVVAMYRVLQLGTASDDQPPFRLSGAATVVVASLLVAGLASGQWRTVYRDDAIRVLNTTVSGGPYAGIRTSAAKADYVTGLQHALERTRGDSRSMIAFNGLPSAFLMIPVRPALPTTWISEYDQDFFIRLRRALAAEVPRAARPVLVLQLFRIPVTTTYDVRWSYEHEDPLLQAVMAQSPRTMARFPDFTIYQIRAPRAGR